MDNKSYNLDKIKIEHYLTRQSNQNTRTKIRILRQEVKRERKCNYTEEQNHFVQ